MKLGIIGLGLIGGSLAKAFKKSMDVSIVAYNRGEEALQLALSEGICDVAAGSVDERFSDCDVIFICTVPDSIGHFVQLLKPLVKKDCILTDVGSTKKNIYDKMMQEDQLYFIGGHPMAGSEKTGYRASQAHLFENAYYVLTPLPRVPKEKIEFLKEILQKTGAIPIVMTPQTHDQTVAAISHLPHVLASTLVSLVETSDNESKNLHTLAAGGFRDLTRIASGSPELWSTICMENKKEILNAVASYQDSLSAFQTLLSNEDPQGLYDFFLAAKQYRDSFQFRLAGAYPSMHEIKVDVVDLPGSIATISSLLSASCINIKNIGIMNNRDFESGVMQIVFDNLESREKGLALLREKGFTVY